VGLTYEKLKKRIQRSHNQKEHMAGSSSESSDEEEEKDKPKDEYEKKRHRKTREDIEKEALLMGDLYAIMGLEDKTFNATL
jgi:hypothetical protein